MAPRCRLSIGWLTLFVVGTDLFMISPLLPAIAKEYGVPAAAAGLSVTVFSVTYMLGAPAIGCIADRLGRRATLVSCLLAFAAANWLTARAPGFGWLLASRIAAGAAAAGISPLIYAGVGEAAPAARRASWMAVAVSGLLSALCLGAPVGSLVAASCGSRQPFVGVAVLSFALAIANRVVWPADPRRGGVKTSPVAGIGAAVLSVRLAPTVLWAAALYGTYTYLGVALAGAGYAPAQSACAISLYGIAALAGTLIGGHAADRFGTQRTMLASLAGLALCLPLLGLSLNTGWTAGLMLMTASLCAQLFFPAQQAGLARDFPERRATALACNNSALFLGISLGSLIGGKAIASGGFIVDTTIGATIAGAAAISAVVTGPVRRAVIGTRHTSAAASSTRLIVH